MTPFDLYTIKKMYKEETGNIFPFCDDITKHRPDIEPDEIDYEFIINAYAYIQWLQEKVILTKK